MIYYYENPVGINPDCGRFEADSDEEAIEKVPETVVFLYRESDTKDGLPFEIIFDKSKKEVNNDS